MSTPANFSCKKNRKWLNWLCRTGFKCRWSLVHCSQNSWITVISLYLNFGIRKWIITVNGVYICIERVNSPCPTTEVAPAICIGELSVQSFPMDVHWHGSSPCHVCSEQLRWRFSAKNKNNRIIRIIFGAGGSSTLRINWFVWISCGCSATTMLMFRVSLFVWINITSKFLFSNKSLELYADWTL